MTRSIETSSEAQASIETWLAETWLAETSIASGSEEK